MFKFTGRQIDVLQRKALNVKVLICETWKKPLVAIIFIIIGPTLFLGVYVSAVAAAFL